MSQDTSHYSSINSEIYHVGVDGRGGTSSHDTRHFYSHNYEARVNVEC